MSAHKLEWTKQFKSMQKRQQVLDDELDRFIQSNPLIQKEKLRATSLNTKKQSNEPEWEELDPEKEALIQKLPVSRKESSISATSAAETEARSDQLVLETGLLETPYEQQAKLKYFQQDLMENVKSIRSVVQSLKEDIKNCNFAKTVSKQQEHKMRYNKKREEVKAMFGDVSDMLDQIGTHLFQEQQMLLYDIHQHKLRLSEVLGFGDEVKGFDQITVDESIDHLDIYAEFLGVEEYEKAKESYIKALQTLESIYKLEIERLQFLMMPQTTHY